MAKLKPKVSMRVNREILKEFAAEISRITNYPIAPETVNRAIEAVKPKLIEGGNGEGEEEAGSAEEAS